MSDKRTYMEKNIKKLIHSSFKEENQLDAQQKNAVLNMLLLKVDQQKRDLQPEPLIVIGLSVIWIVLSVLLFSKFKNSIYMLDFIKAALGLSMFLIPVSSIILIILKSKRYEKKLV